MKVSIDQNPKYSVTEDGRVINNYTDKELKGQPDKNGYLKVRLYTNGKVFKDYYIHKLVAENFVEIPKCFDPDSYENLSVTHIDGNKSNNDATNLRWDWFKNIMVNKHETGTYRDHIATLKKPIIGTSLSSGNVVKFDSIVDAAKFISKDNYISVSVAISQCLRGLSKSAYGYTWSFHLQ